MRTTLDFVIDFTNIFTQNPDGNQLNSTKEDNSRDGGKVATHIVTWIGKVLVKLKQEINKGQTQTEKTKLDTDPQRLVVKGNNPLNSVVKGFFKANESSIMKLATSPCLKIFVLLSFSKPVISFDNRLETVVK